MSTPIVPIIMGSKSDLPHGRRVQEALGRFGIESEIHMVYVTIAVPIMAGIILFHLLAQHAGDQREPAGFGTIDKSDSP